MNKELFEKYLNDQCTPKEEERVYKWLQTSEGEAYLKENIDRDIRVSEEFEGYIEHPDIPSEKIFTKIQLNKNNHFKNLPKKNSYSFWRWIGVAAASILLLFSAVFYFQQVQRQNQPESQKSPYPVIIATAQAQDTTVSLVDGSRIILDGDSRLEILEGYSSEHRNVQLRGKAFFDVKEEKTRPFIVETSHSYIKVLGTKFEVETDSNIARVKVEEGKVRFFSKDKRVDPIDLRSGEYGILRLNNKEDSLAKEDDASAQNRQKPILTRHQTIKENSKFKFSKNRLFVAAIFLERKYDVDIEIMNDSLRNIQFTLETEQSLLGAIEQITDYLDLTYQYNKQENKLLLKKKEHD